MLRVRSSAAVMSSNLLVRFVIVIADSDIVIHEK
jgi:hypothetical protein